MFEINFLSSKSTWEVNKCEEHAVTWWWPPLLVTSLHWSHHMDQKAFVTSLVCFHIAFGSCQVAVDFFCENEFLYKGRHNVRISQTWEFLILDYLCPFARKFTVKLAFVVTQCLWWFIDYCIHHVTYCTIALSCCEIPDDILVLRSALGT